MSDLELYGAAAGLTHAPALLRSGLGKSLAAAGDALTPAAAMGDTAILVVSRKVGLV